MLVGVTQFLIAQEAPEGLWFYQDTSGQTVFHFTQLESGEVQGQIVSKTGYSKYTPYISKNPQYNGKTLLNTVWLSGLVWKSSGLWVGGLMVDIRNDQGKLFYCQLRLSADKTNLTITSIGGLARKDRNIVLYKLLDQNSKISSAKKPKDEPPGNLVENLWKDNKELNKSKDENQERPIFNPVIKSEPNGGFSINIFTFSF